MVLALVGALAQGRLSLHLLHSEQSILLLPVELHQNLNLGAEKMLSKLGSLSCFLFVLFYIFFTREHRINFQIEKNVETMKCSFFSSYSKP